PLRRTVPTGPAGAVLRDQALLARPVTGGARVKQARMDNQLRRWRARLLARRRHEFPANCSSPTPTVRPRPGGSMRALIHPKTITVDGLSVRYAEGGQDGPDAILMSPWPESVYAFEPAWPHLAAAAHLVAIDPPGFGGSDYRQTLMNPKAMGHFILNVV